MGWKKGVPQTEEHKQKRIQKLKSRTVTWGYKISISNRLMWKKRKENFTSSSARLTKTSSSTYCQKCGQPHEILLEIEIPKYKTTLKYCKQCYEGEYQ